MILEAYKFSDTGGRNYNEDYVDYRINKDRGIFVVADGLGGHANGEIASSTAVNYLIDAWERESSVITPEWLVRNITEANQAILTLQTGKHNTLKTTIAALVIEDGKAFSVHAGDSRIYHLRGGRLVSVTADHSVAYKKYKWKEISRDQIAGDPDQSHLLSALGEVDSMRLQKSPKEIELTGMDSFFLCTDGVWEYLKDMEILIDRLKSSDCREWANHCLFRMLARVDGKNDNLSLLTIMVHSDEV